MEHGKLFSPHKAGVLEDETRLGMLSEQTLVRLLNLSGAEDIADLGSGTGFYTDRVAAWTTGLVYAVELQPEMQRLHLAKHPPANVRPVLGDIEALPLPPGSLDRALSINTFHETHGRVGLARLARALRPQALYVIVDWRKAAEAAGIGPPLQFRLSAAEVESVLAPWFTVVAHEVVSPWLEAHVARLS